MASFTLKDHEGAVPGKKRKVSASTNRDEKKKEYEKHREERKFHDEWKSKHDWLVYDEEKKIMTCLRCQEFYGKCDGETAKGETNLRNANTFIEGSTNFRKSAPVDHEKSKSHMKASEFYKSKQKTTPEKAQSEAGVALLKLKTAERGRLAHLFRNAHAVVKNNRPLTDFNWLCKLDMAKHIDVGITYHNEKAAAAFIHSIAITERQKTSSILENKKFVAFMMDGSTDISGDEQETIYVRGSLKGSVMERFLHIGTPKSTRSQDLHQHVMDVFKENNIDTGKVVAMGSDGASNMTGVRGGLATLMRENNPEMVNVHCLCHRLELAFRDVVKKDKLYDKLMTLLIGLYYFYKKSYKNKQGLKTAITAMKGGVFPTKVTGTRWLPHLCRGIGAFLKTYNALEAHLSTVSHDNAKGEGLLKLMLDKHLMAFVLFLQILSLYFISKDSLDPAMRLSLKLQKPEVNLSDSLCWVDATIELLSEKKERNCKALSQLLETGEFQGVTLKGSTPKMAYRDKTIDGFCSAIQDRFQTADKNVLNATKILNLKCWPLPGSIELAEFGAEDVVLVCNHFENTLQKAFPGISEDELTSEWSLLKKLVTKKFGDLSSLCWGQVFQQITDLPMIMLLVDLMLTIPSTSVTCETAFSQLKLLKTSRRSRLGPAVVNDMMLVKLESPEISAFVPDRAIDTWLADSTCGRRTTYKRVKASNPETAVIIVSDTEEVAQPETDPVTVRQEVSDTEEPGPQSDSAEMEEEEPPALQLDTFVSFLMEMNRVCDKDEDYDDEEDFYDSQNEMLNFEKLMFYRE